MHNHGVGSARVGQHVWMAPTGPHIDMLTKVIDWDDVNVAVH